jgi:hypothetical protein
MVQSLATLTDYPQALRQRFGDTVSFSTIAGLSWDGTDWCQYDEVLPTPEDAQILSEKNKQDDFVEARVFFQK